MSLKSDDKTFFFLFQNHTKLNISHLNSSIFSLNQQFPSNALSLPGCSSYICPRQGRTELQSQISWNLLGQGYGVQAWSVVGGGPVA